MEAAFQQNFDELQTARDEARQQSSQHRQEVQKLQLQLAALEADVNRLTASESMWKERSEKATEQVGFLYGTCPESSQQRFASEC